MGDGWMSGWIYPKELAHTVVGVSMSQINRAAAGTFQPTGSCYSPGAERLLVLLLRLSIDWMRPTHIIRGDLLHLKATD